MANKPLIEVKGLTKHFRIAGNGPGSSTVLKAVENVYLTLNPGETLGLVGESGCGKSTFGRTLLNLLPATDGEIHFDGQRIEGLGVRQMRPLRRRMQMIFQDPYASLNPRMTIAKSVRAPLDVMGEGSREERDKKVRDILEYVGIGERFLNAFPHEMSGGQRQRIVIARAMITNPEFIVCDEPVSALDVSVRSQVLNLMRRLQKERNLSYLFISHDLSVVKYICDRIAVMYLGRIVETGTTAEIFSNPRHPYTQALLSAIPEPRVRRNRKRVILQGDIPSPINPPGGCPFHPRCPFATQQCRTELPTLANTGDGPGHQAACFRQGEQLYSA